MSFTDQKRRIATEKDCSARWSGAKDGKNFRCAMCGHRFQVGDGWRWQYGQGRSFESDTGATLGVRNFLVCDECDGPDVLDRWVARNEDFYGPRLWALR